MSSRVIAVSIFVVFSRLAQGALSADPPAFRAPAVPLVAINPNLSVWSMADRLTDDVTRHWTRHPHPLVGLIRVDGKAYRLMGTQPKGVPALPQTAVRVLPTRSIYDFEGAGVKVSLTFLTPALPGELEVLARPLTYLVWSVESADGAEHAVSLYESTSGLLAVNTPDQKVEWSKESFGDLTALRAGTVDQPLLRPAGDDVRIDWGYVYAAARSGDATAAAGSSASLADAFAAGRPLAGGDQAPPRAANDREPALAFAFDLGRVGQKPVARRVMIAYDEVYAIDFLGRKLRPYWRRDGATPADLFTAADRDFEGLTRRCEAFDTELMADMTRSGGERFAQLGALAYRQALAGCGLAADANKQPMLFPKENSSNGCVATVDVIYPAAPLFLLMGPTYAKALVVPALVYSASPRWKFPFAPHDVGTYPQATGQVYAGGESSTNEGDMMPVEESGNMILLSAAIAKMEGNADFASRWWPQLTRWEAYLEKYGKDPENQLCTDDFMGHLAHNANLSVKAILAIAAYGELCRMRGDQASAAKFKSLAREYARNWTQVAADKDHYRIAFDRPNSWSQKYNLVWDKLLGLDVFPKEVARQEIAFYKTRMQRFGPPLDSRTRLTKTDWCLWTATMADTQSDFRAIVDPIYDYMNVTTARLPMVDSYLTDNPASDGMRARPVIGGVFIKMLEDGTTWRKWADRDKARAGGWALAPTPPRITEVVATSARVPALWRYSLARPEAGWVAPAFDDSGWRKGPGGFGARGTPGAVVGTEWTTPDIWLRREVVIPEGTRLDRLELSVYHDEGVAIYLDGVLAAREEGYLNGYQPLPILPAARARLKPGAKVVIAVHCHQTTGGQGVDVGLVDVVPQDDVKP